MKDTVNPSRKPRVLLELRPAFDGYAGIPQETRLLFRGLRMLESCEVAGMLQTSHRILAMGTYDHGLFFNSAWLSPAARINRYSRVALSAAEHPYATVLERVLDACTRRFMSATRGRLWSRCSKAGYRSTSKSSKAMARANSTLPSST